MAALLLLGLLLAPAPRAATPSQPAAFLAAARHAWVGRMALLRGFPTANKLEYGPDGQPLKAGPEGPWTLAEMRVNRVARHGGELRISGEREGLLLHNRVFDAVELHQKIRLTIQLGADPLDQATIQKLTEAIFLPTAELPRAVPKYWAWFEHGPPPPAEAPARPGGRVDRPTLISSPHPRYTTAARNARVQGTVVLSLIIGTDGRGHDIEVVQPLGLGLDYRAVQAVRRWRFRPATMGGQPVRVRANVRVNFSLY
ncbi:MAG: energy transducer TonB [Terriglobales bacterium]